MLRATCCVICGELLPKPGRLNRRYCRKSCRAVAYRARHREDRPSPALRLSAPGDSEVTRSLLYTRIPREVLDVLARHFDQQRELLAAELTAARTRIAELEKTSATEPAGAAALEDRRRLEAEVQQLRGELTETRSSLTAQLETAKRQLREAFDLRGQAEQVPKLKTELESIRADLDNARAVAATSADEKRRLESDLQQARDALTKSRGTLTAQLDAEKRKQEQTERSLRMSEQRCDALKGQLADAKAALSEHKRNEDEGQKTHAAALAASAARWLHCRRSTQI
jgi:chromosome segregation ATPase